MTDDDRQWLEGRFNGLEHRLGKRIDDSATVATVRLNDHTKRIRRLEVWRAGVVGVGVAIGAVGKGVVDYLTRRG